MPRPLSTTGQALLGLLALRSWTAYELTQQMRRALRWAWPRSEANLYGEVKRLVPRGLAVAVDEQHAGRARTRYEITERGRAEVAAWLATEPSEPQLQFEAMLRLFLADLGTPDELRRTLEVTRRHVLERAQEVLPIIDEYRSGDPPFPERAHLNALFIRFYAGFYRLLLDWCDEVEAELATWPSTAGVGLTPFTRQALAEAATFYQGVIERCAGEASGEEDRP